MKIVIGSGGIDISTYAVSLLADGIAETVFIVQHRSVPIPLQDFDLTTEMVSFLKRIRVAILDEFFPAFLTYLMVIKENYFIIDLFSFESAEGLREKLPLFVALLGSINANGTLFMSDDQYRQIFFLKDHLQFY